MDRPDVQGMSESKSVLKSAGAMGIATFSSRILGLVREQVFAILFGASNATDAFIIAFRIPNLFRDLFAEGAMSASLVPTFTRVRTQEGDRRAWRVAGLVFRVLFGITGVLSVLGILFAPQLVDFYASAYHQIEGKFELTVSMTRVMFPFFPLVALAAAFMGILNACGRFFIPAFSSALFNATSIVSGVILVWILPHFSIQPIIGMAIGVVIGGAVQAFCQFPLLRKAGYRWFSSDPSLHWHRDPALREMLYLMLPGMVGLAATQINVLVNSILATSQMPGAVSWLSYSFRLMQFPIGIFGVSLAVAAFPRVSQQWVNQDYAGARFTIEDTLKHVFAINLPASAGLAFLGYPIIQLIFEYGRFTPMATEKTALALAAYSVGLTAYSCVKVLVPAFYAMGNTRIPVLSSVLSVLLTISLNLLMIGPFGFAGLALGTSLAAVFNALFLLGAVKILFRRVQLEFPLLPLFKSFLGHLGMSLGMGGVCWLSYRGLGPLIPDFIFSDYLGKTGIILIRALKVGVICLEGITLVVIFAHLTGFAEFNQALDFFSKKLRKKLS